MIQEYDRRPLVVKWMELKYVPGGLPHLERRCLVCARNQVNIYVRGDGTFQGQCWACGAGYALEDAEDVQQAFVAWATAQEQQT